MQLSNFLRDVGEDWRAGGCICRWRTWSNSGMRSGTSL